MFTYKKVPYKIFALGPKFYWAGPGPSDRVFFDTFVIWGLVGPKWIFGSLGSYEAMNWFFLGGAIGLVIVWLLLRHFQSELGFHSLTF